MAAASSDPSPTATADTPAAKLTEALARAQADFPAIPKTKTAKVQTKSGSEYSYSYADLSDVLAAVRPALANNGLAVMQKTLRDPAGPVLVTELRHVGGGVERTELELGRNASDPQAFGSTLSYLRRYELITLLGLSPEDDRDAQDVPKATRSDVVPAPAWAFQAKPATKRRALDELVTLLNGDKDRAMAILKDAGAVTGKLADGTAEVIRVVAKALGPEGTAAWEAQRTAGADQGGEPEPAAAPDPDAAPAPASDVKAPELDAAEWAAAADDETLERVARAVEGADPLRVEAANAELARRAAQANENTPAAATIPVPDDLPADPAKASAALRELGCTCQNPTAPPHDDACPIIGHGIPF